MSTPLAKIEPVSRDRAATSGARVVDLAASSERGDAVLAISLPIANTQRPLGLARRAKYALDFVLAGAALIALAPAMLLIAILLRIDGGKALFGHARIGENGHSFNCLKFRTMVPDAEARLREVLANDPEKAEEWRETQKLKDDPRVTRVGRFLRNTSLDELPQLVNVLRGEMSLVGPRPIVTAELVRYGDHLVDYLSTRPGITGLWQISGRSDTSYDERVRLDARYVRDWSLWLDLKILLSTIPVLLSTRGAC